MRFPLALLPLLFATALVTMSFLSPTPARAQTSSSDAALEEGLGTPRWSALQMEGSKLFVTATTHLRLDPVGQAQLGEALAKIDRGKATLPRARADGGRPPAWRLGIETKVLGRRSTEEIHFDSATLGGLQRFKQRHGSKTYTKTYRFAADGVLQLRASPADVDEATGPRKNWSQRSETWYAHPAPRSCTATLDASALIYLASARQWKKPGERLDLCVFSSKTFSRVEIRHAGTRSVDYDFEVDGQPHEGSVEAIALELAPRALGVEDEPFEMLGLGGNLLLLVDPQSGLPLEIHGKMSPGGDVTVRLVSATLRR